jgi:hypothetical protein
MPFILAGADSPQMLETPAPPAGGMIDEAGRRDDPERDRLAVLALLLAARWGRSWQLTGRLSHRSITPKTAMTPLLVRYQMPVPHTAQR